MAVEVVHVLAYSEWYGINHVLLHHWVVFVHGIRVVVALFV